MHIQPFQALYPDTGLISSADHFCLTVKEEFKHYLQSGFFKKMPQDGIYIHHIATARRHFTGLIACVDIEDYLDGSIKRHEHTIAPAEQSQMHLLLHRNAQVKPVMLTYRNVPEIDNAIARFTASNPQFLEVRFEDAKETHRFWAISDGRLIEQFQQLFSEKVPSTYIADGHHRTSADARLFERYGVSKPDNPFRWLTCALYPTAELEIHDFNRIIEGLNDLTPTVFMAKLSQLFDIEVLEEAEKPRRKTELTMFLDREWFRLNWRPEVLEEFYQESILLDVTLLNEKVLKNILHIKDVRTDARVKYLEGPKGLGALKEKTIKSEERLAFCLYPVAMVDFLAVSDANDVLPPKSTWFEPRIRSGLVVRHL
jgi:uncharacterized protein (DUF1015 family)